jgi:hypothetical protein
MALTLFMCVLVGRMTSAQSSATTGSVLTLAVLRNATDAIRPAQQVKPKLASARKIHRNKFLSERILT